MSDLVSSLNRLLLALDLPFTLQSPEDLTPSLLCAILACILRRPISNFNAAQNVCDNSLDDTISVLTELSRSNCVDSDAKSSFHVKQMKIFLGVLEHDVLRTDVGLSTVDPRNLAMGAWDEVVFVGELLVWLGQNLGWIPGSSHSSNFVRSRLVDEPIDASLQSVWNQEVQDEGCLASSATATSMFDQVSSFSGQIYHTLSASDFTSLSASDSATLTSSHLPPESTSLSSENANFTPRCIHELQIDPTHFKGRGSTSVTYPTPSSPSHFDDSTGTKQRSTLANFSIPEISSCTCDNAPYAHPCPAPVSPPKSLLFATRSHSASPPVRYEGSISLVDEESEISAFEEMRSNSAQRVDSLTTPPRIPRQYHSPGVDKSASRAFARPHSLPTDADFWQPMASSSRANLAPSRPRKDPTSRHESYSSPMPPMTPIARQVPSLYGSLNDRLRLMDERALLFGGIAAVLSRAPEPQMPT